MASLNKVILIGHLTETPELKQTTNGVSVVSFKIGVARKYKVGEQQKSDFISCVAWRQNAEFICKYFRKGNAICVCGSIQNREYDENEKKRYATEVIVDEATFVEKKEQTKQEEKQVPEYTEVSIDSDLPF